MDKKDWIEGLNRIESRDVPITISGGEPLCHPDFYEIVNAVKKPMDLLTNGQFDVKEFMTKIGARKFKRQAPYASIRFSYHPGITPMLKLFKNLRLMQSRGYYVGIWAIIHPAYFDEILTAKTIAENPPYYLDFRFKDYLGYYNGKLFGNYKYPEMLDKTTRTDCLCKPSELLIAPDGKLYRCHSDLYAGVNSYGHLLDKDITVPEDFTSCVSVEACSPCDLKIKFDRFQVMGHCSVEIKEVATADDNHTKRIRND